VRTRKGYLAPDDKKPKTETASAPAPGGAAPALSDADARAALEHLPPSGTPLRLTADYVEMPPNGAHALVRAQMPLTKLDWDKVDGRKHATVHLIGGVYDASGTLIGQPFIRRSELDDYDRAMKEGLRFQQSLVLKPGKYQIKLVARDGKGTALGGATESVEIPDLGQKKLAISGIFLSASTTATDALTDAQVLRHFKKTDNLYFQLYVYNPTKDETGASDVVLQAQLRSGDKLVGATKPQAVTFQEKDGVPVPQTNGMPLEGLTPGPYVLRIVVVDQKSKTTVNGNVDFTLE